MTRWTGTFDLELTGPGGRRAGVLEVHVGLDDVVVCMASRVQVAVSRDLFRRWLDARPRSREEGPVVWSFRDTALSIRVDGEGTAAYPVPVETLDELANVI